MNITTLIVLNFTAILAIGLLLKGTDEWNFVAVTSFVSAHVFNFCICMALSNRMFPLTFEVFLNPFAKGLAKFLSITVCGGIINLQIHQSTCDFCPIFLLDKRCSMLFCMVNQIKSNVHLLYSFIHIFIHNSITKYYWQNFARSLAKAFRKTSSISFQSWPEKQLFHQII